MTEITALMKADPVVLDPEARIEDAWRLMHENRIRHVPICKGNRLVGLVTQKDLLVNAQNAALLSLPVAEIMVFNVSCVDPATDVLAAAEKMLHEKVSCLPVTGDNDDLKGIITESDLMELLVDLLKQR